MRPLLLAPFLLLLFPVAAQAQTGTLDSWGFDLNGQVSSTPDGQDFVQVSAGGNHSLALRSDGTIAAWGSDTEGQVGGVPSGGGFDQVAGGDYHSLALRSDGSIAAWGWDQDGQISGAPSGALYTQVSSGDSHCVAIDRNPVLSVTDFVAGATATLTVDYCDPWAPVFVGYSFAGGGPTPSPWGDLLLGDPYYLFQRLQADAGGRATKSIQIDTGWLYVNAWLHARDAGSNAFSNGLALTVQ